jgi:glutathione S-transferase
MVSLGSVLSVAEHETKLYVILGSHACRTAMLMLEHKGIEYKRIELPVNLHPFLLRLHGFQGNPAPFRSLGRQPRSARLMLAVADRFGTVPALLADGARVKTNREIARFLDRLRPDPPLFPADPERRSAVEEAERWGDEVFQMAARRTGLAGARHHPDGARGADDGRLGPLLWRNRMVRRMGMRMLAVTVFAAGKDAESELLSELPGMLDRIDGWVESGVLNGEQLYAADFMIAPSLALLCYRPDLRPEIERRPLVALVDRLLPEPAAAPA